MFGQIYLQDKKFYEEKFIFGFSKVFYHMPFNDQKSVNNPTKTDKYIYVVALFIFFHVINVKIGTYFYSGFIYETIFPNCGLLLNWANPPWMTFEWSLVSRHFFFVPSRAAHSLLTLSGRLSNRDVRKKILMQNGYLAIKYAFQRKFGDKKNAGVSYKVGGTHMYLPSRKG